MPKPFSKISSVSNANKYILVLDVGTIGVKAFVFDTDLNLITKAYQRLNKKHPKLGWVEQDPQELLSVSQKVLRKAIKTSHCPNKSFLGLGITNQRETTICWDKKTGQAVYPAIVWEDTRTQKYCSSLKKKHQTIVHHKTGLSLDSYFSASKIHWLLKNIPQAKVLADQKQLAFGTIDSWLLWNFIENHPHLTDYSNASRSLIFNIKTLEWDRQLLDLFNLPFEILPQALPSKSFFGNLKKNILGFSLPVGAVCGDQQASMYAAGIIPGTTKATYGTGTFVMQVIGSRFISKDGFFTTLVPSPEGQVYALETKVNNTGKRIDELLRNKLPLETSLKTIAQEVDAILKKLPTKPKVLIVDGGILRDARLIELQNSISKSVVKPQTILDGTALGIAKLSAP